MIRRLRNYDTILMPRYTKLNGEKIPNVRMDKTWYEIPVKANKNSVPINKESYLIQPRVANYIELLEKKILSLGHDLPKIKNK